MSIGIDLAQKLMEFDNIIGLKYTDHNLYDLRRLVELGDERFTVFSGADQILLPALSMGAHGGIGSSYPIMVNAFVNLFKAYKAKKIDEARTYQYKINHVIEILM